MDNNKTPEKRASLSANININNQEKTVNKTFHSRKSLLNTLAKVSKHDPYHKNQYSMEDYHLFTKHDFFHDKVERPNSTNKLSSQDNSRNLSKLNETQEAKSFTSSLRPKSNDKISAGQKKSGGESQIGNDDNFKPQSLYSNYGNFTKNNITKNIQNSDSRSNNSKSKNLTSTFNDHTQTLNLTEADFMKNASKKDNQNFNFNNSNFLEENEIYELQNNNKHNEFEENKISNSYSKSLINQLNKLNKIDLIIENTSDIPFDDQCIDGEEIKSILNSIFMEYAKYAQAENNYLLSFQSTFTIFKTLNIIHDKIIKYNDFGVLLQSQVGKSQKVNFEAFLEIIAKVSLKLFDCFSSNPEKCIYFLVKSHFEPVFSTGKVNLYLNNTLKKTNNNVFYPHNSLASVAPTSNSIFLEEENCNLTKNADNNFNQSKRGVNSRSLPPKIENKPDSIKYSNFNISLTNSNKNNLNDNKTPNRKIKFDVSSDHNLNQNPSNNYNNIHGNFDNQITSNILEQPDKNKASIDSNFNLTNNMTFKDLENWLKSTPVDFKTKILFNSITPTLLVLYKAYFEQELKRTFTKVNIVKKSSESLLSFCKDFLIIPNYLSFNLITNYYNIACSDSNILDHLYKNEVFSKEGFFKIHNYENDNEVYKGVYFDFYKFCIGLIHIGLLMFPKLQRKHTAEASKGNRNQTKMNSTNANFLNTTKEFLYEEKDNNSNADNNNNKSKNHFANYSVSEKMLVFLDYLEESNGLRTAEKKLTRINCAKLTFIPAIEVKNLIKQKPENAKNNGSFGSITENMEESEHDSNENKKQNDAHNNFKNIDNLDKHGSLKDMKIRDILDPSVSDKTFLKLQVWLSRLREIFSFYSISYEKINIDKMNFSCFMKFLRDSNLVCSFTNVGSSKNNMANSSKMNNESAFRKNRSLANHKTLNNENDEKIFNSRIFGECIVPQKVESVLTFQKYNEKLAQKMKKMSRENSLVGNNANNTNSNKSFLSNINYSQIANSNNNINNNNNKENTKRPSDNTNKSAFTAEQNQAEFVDENSNNNSFLGESIDLSINNNINANNNLHSRTGSENNILLNNNNNNPSANNTNIIKQNHANNTSPNLNLYEFNENRNDNKSIYNVNGNLNKTTVNKANDNEIIRNGLAENEVSIIFLNLVGKKNYDIKKLTKNEKKKSQNNLEEEEEKSFVNEKKNILKNSTLNPQKLNFNLFVKALELIANKFYYNVIADETDNKSRSNYVDKSFEKFIDCNIPLIYDVFINKYNNHQRFKNSEISIFHFLEHIQEERIASLVKDMQEYVKIFFINYSDKHGLITFEKSISFLKDFNIYPIRINLLFTKNLFGHYSELFSIIVNSYKNGAIDFMEIERKGKLNEVRNNLERDFNILNEEPVLQEIKKLIASENRINLPMFNQFLAIVSLKIKCDSKISEFEKAFYIYEIMASKDDAIKKILLKNGHTFNSGLDYKNYLRIIKEKYSDCFGNNNFDLKNELNEESVKFSNLFRK